MESSTYVSSELYVHCVVDVYCSEVRCRVRTKLGQNRFQNTCSGICSQFLCSPVASYRRLSFQPQTNDVKRRSSSDGNEIEWSCHAPLRWNAERSVPLIGDLGCCTLARGGGSGDEETRFQHSCDAAFQEEVRLVEDEVASRGADETCGLVFARKEADTKKWSWAVSFVNTIRGHAMTRRLGR